MSSPANALPKHAFWLELAHVEPGPSSPRSVLSSADVVVGGNVEVVGGNVEVVGGARVVIADVTGDVGAGVGACVTGVPVVGR